MRPLALAALCIVLAACGGNGKQEPHRTLNLGGVTMREDEYVREMRRLVRSDSEVCDTWLREGTEPVTAFANKTTDGAFKSDLVYAMALVSRECFARQRE